MQRFSHLALVWRVFGVNAALLALATLLIAVTPVTIHASVSWPEAVGLLCGLALISGVNLLLLQPILRPIGRLARRMDTVDLLHPDQRLAAGGGREVEELVTTFNRMLERLEAERRASSRRALDAQEAERLRIAHGLHDEVGQVLTGVLLQLDALEGVDGDAQLEAIAETKAAVRVALDEVRRIAYELRPAMLEHLGLVSALRELATTFAARSGLDVTQRFESELPRLSSEAEIAVYRVTQEGLTNVARHAQASSVSVSLEQGARSVVLRIADDGVGFAERSALANGGSGIRGMRERALLIGGALAVRSGRTGGTEIRLEVPGAG
jgi:two-component system sensor histidine kinase UhpB